MKSPCATFGAADTDLVNNPSMVPAELTDALLSAPVGAGVVMVAARSGLGLAGLTDPVTVTALAAAVCAQLTPWSGEHQELSRWLIDQACPLRDLAADAAQHPATRFPTATLTGLRRRRPGHIARRAAPCPRRTTSPSPE